MTNFWWPKFLINIICKNVRVIFKKISLKNNPFLTSFGEHNLRQCVSKLTITIIFLSKQLHENAHMSRLSFVTCISYILCVIDANALILRVSLKSRLIYETGYVFLYSKITSNAYWNILTRYVIVFFTLNIRIAQFYFVRIVDWILLFIWLGFVYMCLKI